MKINRDDLLRLALSGKITSSQFKNLYKLLNTAAVKRHSTNVRDYYYFLDEQVLPGAARDLLKLFANKSNMVQLEEYDSQTLLLMDEDYPDLLKETNDPPKILYFRGNPDLLRKFAIAIVGTRKATSNAAAEVNHLLNMLADYDLITVSGMAYGIDALVHEKSISRNIPTIAVLPTGLENPTPQGNINLARQILNSGGLLVSEFSGLKAYSKYVFPMRNRIIAGMSAHTVVIEAPQKSGALSTAHYAHSYDRDVFVAVGDMRSANLAGNFSLLDSLKATVLTPTYLSLKLELEKQTGRKTATNKHKTESEGGLSEAIKRAIMSGRRTIPGISAYLHGYEAKIIQTELAKMLLSGLISRDNSGEFHLK